MEALQWQQTDLKIQQQDGVKTLEKNRRLKKSSLELKYFKILLIVRKKVKYWFSVGIIVLTIHVKSLKPLLKEEK